MKTTSDIVAIARKGLRQDDAESALQAISKAVNEYQNHPQCDGILCDLPKLDALCQEIGTHLLKKRPVVPVPPPQPIDLYIASELYAIGGHTALIGDYVQNSPQREARLFLTNHRNRQATLKDPIRHRTGLPEAAVEIATDPSWVGKFYTLNEYLLILNPSRVFILTHPEDPLVICQPPPASQAEWYFIHHADHSPALGLHLPNVRHVDVTPRAHQCCRQILGLGGNIYLPLQCKESSPPPTPRPPTSLLTIASCGSTGKFNLEGPAALHEIITHLLRHTAHRYIHFGPLPEAYLQSWRGQLISKSIDPFRFLHIPSVESLWEALQSYQIDLYLNSFPHPGARASIEAMGAGIPLLTMDQPDQSHSLLYPTAEKWRTPGDLLRLIEDATPTWLKDQSHAARQHFQTHHSTDIIRPLFAHSPIEGSSPTKMNASDLNRQRCNIQSLQRLLSN